MANLYINLPHEIVLLKYKESLIAPENT